MSNFLLLKTGKRKRLEGKGVTPLSSGRCLFLSLIRSPDLQLNVSGDGRGTKEGPSGAKKKREVRQRIS